jgi:aspartate/methionine/tyrosine aminotransferase
MHATMRQSLRMQAVQSPIIPVVAELIRQNPGTISLGQGVVSYGPPPEAVARISQFLADGENHKYRPVHGIAPLIEALERKLADENGVCIGPDRRIIVTAGANMGFMNAVLAIADPGDELILLTPFYFNYEMAIGMGSCRAVCVPTDENYQPRLDAIERAIGPRTRAVVTISPNNPTGAVYPEAALRAINDLCRQRGIYHIHDEAYEYFTYGTARHFSPGSIEGSAEHTISLLSFSKTFGFASWRIGYMVFPQHLFEAIRKIQDTNIICPPVICQYAALGALEAGRSYCLEKLKSVSDVRTVVMEHLAELGELCTVPRADGAFYFLLRIHSDIDPMILAERLIREHRVAVIPGMTFGIGGCYLRVSYGALTRQSAEEGIDRLVRGLKAIVG